MPFLDPDEVAEVRKERFNEMVILKVKWLLNIINECIAMDIYYEMGNTDLLPIVANVQKIRFHFERQKESYPYGNTNGDRLKYCNTVLQHLKQRYEFELDSYGDIKGKMYNDYIFDK